MNNTNDIIITAVQKIAENLTTQQKFDRTIQVVIYNPANVEEREYDVEYQNTLFRVYAKEGETYKTGDTVYVKIPEKDFSQKIYIEGVVTADAGLPVDKTEIVEIEQPITYEEGLNLSSGFYRVSAKFTNKENNKDEYTLKITDSISFGFQDFTGNPFKFNGTEQIKYITLINETEINPMIEGNFTYSDLSFTPCEIILLNENEAYLTIYTPNGNNLNTTDGTSLEGKCVEKGKEITPDKIQWYYANPTGYSTDVGQGWSPINEATNLIYSATKAGKYLLFVKKDGIILTKTIEVIGNVSIIKDGNNLKLSNNGSGYWAMDKEEFSDIATKTYAPQKAGTVYCKLQNNTETILTYNVFVQSTNGPDYEIRWQGRECFLYDVDGYSIDRFDEKEWTLRPSVYADKDASKFTLTWLASDGEELTSNKKYSPENYAFKEMWVDSENVLHFSVPRSLSWYDYRDGRFTLKVKDAKGIETAFVKEIVLIRQGETGTNGNGYVAVLRPNLSRRVLAFDTDGFPINLFGSEVTYSEIKDENVTVAQKSITTIDNNNKIVCLYPEVTDKRFPLYIMYDTNGYNPKYDKAGVIESFEPDNSIDNKFYQKIENGGKIVAYVLKYHNIYGSEVINDWDGITTIIGDNSILAQQIIAGEKDSTGTFTGLVMGKDSQQTNVGLYGYSKGTNSFGLLADGTAYFGNGKKGIYLDPEDNRIKLGEDVVISWGLTEDDLKNDYRIDKIYYLDPKDQKTVISSSYLYSPEIEAGVFRVIGEPMDKTTPSGQEVKQFSAYHLCDEDNYSNGALYYRLLGEDTAVANMNAVYLRAGLDFDEDNEYNYTVALKLEATGNVSIGAGTTWASEGGATQTHDENYFIYCHNKIVGNAWGYGSENPNDAEIKGLGVGQLYFQI